MGEQLAHLFWSDGSGTRATVGSYAASVITLKDKRDIARFAKNMRLKFKTGATLLAGYAIVTKRDGGAGKLTITLHDGLADPLADDTIARKGDYTSTGGNVMDGFFSWIPKTDPSATLFNGVDRTVDLNRLSGTRVPCKGMTMEDAAIEGAAEIKFQGGSPDLLVVNTKRQGDLAKSAHSKMWFDSAISGEKGTYKFSVKTMAFMGPDGPIDIVGDPKCPYDYGAFMKRDTIILKSLKDLPHWSTEAGMAQLVPTDDAIQVRLKGYANWICHRPIDNGLLDFATAA